MERGEVKKRTVERNGQFELSPTSDYRASGSAVVQSELGMTPEQGPKSLDGGSMRIGWASMGSPGIIPRASSFPKANEEQQTFRLRHGP